MNGQVYTVYELTPTPAFGLSEAGLAIEEMERKERKKRDDEWKWCARNGYRKK